MVPESGPRAATRIGADAPWLGAKAPTVLRSHAPARPSDGDSVEIRSKRSYGLRPDGAPRERDRHHVGWRPMTDEPRDPAHATEVHRVAEPGATRVASYLAEPEEVHRVLLLYSGGLDTSVMLDRKSTRLNSSHANISYAVFCLKKKNICLPRAMQNPAQEWMQRNNLST